MPPTSDQLAEYLVPAEQLTGVYTGTLREQSTQRPVAIGLTDRRLLCLGEDGTFVNVGYDSISTVQSQPRSMVTYHGNDYRLLLGTGGLFAVGVFVAATLLASSLLAPLFVLTSVAGIVAGVYLHRNEMDDAEVYTRLTGARDVIERAEITAVIERAETTIEDVFSLQERLDRLDEPRGGQQLVRTACWVVAAGSFVGVALVTSAVYAVLAVGSIIGGLALCEYAHRRREELDGIELRRREQCELQISTDGGRTVHIESEPKDAIDRELSRLAFVADGEPVAPVTATS